MDSSSQWTHKEKDKAVLKALQILHTLPDSNMDGKFATWSLFPSQKMEEVHGGKVETYGGDGGKHPSPSKRPLYFLF